MLWFGGVPCAVAVGVLQHWELAVGVSTACHTPNDANPPVWWPTGTDEWTVMALV